MYAYNRYQHTQVKSASETITVYNDLPYFILRVPK